MFGNKFAGDEIAKAFYNQMKKTASVEKKAFSPEDMLMADDGQADKGLESALTDKIADLENSVEDKEDYVKDSSCVCDEKSESCDECPKCKEGGCPSDDDSSDDAMDYYVNREAAHVISELGKMAGRLRRDNKSFAADMVEATAMSIRDDIVKEATQRSLVTSGLKRMAKDMHDSGDKFASDLILATISGLEGRS